MKNYTDIEQSRKLAEILPLESADMHYSTLTILDDDFIVSPNQGSTVENLIEEYGNQIIPCWSLAALLDVLPTYIKHYNYDTRTYKNYNLNLYKAYYCNVSYSFGPSTDENDDTLYCYGDSNFVDACVKMIIKLHERKLL